MNLASKDIRHNVGRFALTTLGVGMLLMVVMGMGGIYQGIVEDATLLIDRIGADLWIVQRHTRGPFAEVSRVPPIWCIGHWPCRACRMHASLSITPFSANGTEPLYGSPSSV
jgi:hypothetical protein